MSYHARIYSRATGAFLLALTVRARSIGEAEDRARAVASYELRGDPRDMDVRRLHELPRATGRGEVGE